MHCPLCDYELQKLFVKTTSGGKFEVDHCGRCGGTWFDPYEINRIPYHEVLRIANLTVNPKKPNWSTHEEHCPRCHRLMEPFASESLPAGISMLRCQTCHGIWATQRALSTFKEHQEETVLSYKERTSVFPSLSVVFVPAIALVLLFATTFASLVGFETERDTRTRAAELVRQVTILPQTDTAVSMNVQTATAVTVSLSYGTSALTLTTVPVSNEPATDHAIILAGLVPDTRYIYRFTLTDTLGRTITTPFETFNTGNTLQ